MSTIYSIIDIELAKIVSRLKAKGLTMTLNQPAKDFLIEKGYNPDNQAIDTIRGATELPGSKP